MKFGKRVAALACAGVLCLSLAACGEMNGQDQEIHNTYEAGNTLMKNQPTPTDLEYSLERYNLIRRAYWVNGQREKAINLPCEVNKPLSYIVLFTESGALPLMARFLPSTLSCRPTARTMSPPTTPMSGFPMWTAPLVRTTAAFSSSPRTASTWSGTQLICIPTFPSRSLRRPL